MKHIKIPRSFMTIAVLCLAVFAASKDAWASCIILTGIALVFHLLDE
jgi:hypothetical protein